MLPGRSVAGLLLCLVLPFSLNAQQTSENNDASDTAEHKKALDLLETVAAGISTLRSPENRITVSLEVADLLWTRDQKRARVLFDTVSRDMANIIESIDASDNQASNSFYWASNQRQQIVGRLAQRDPQIALTFLRTTRFPSDVTFNPNMERDLELFLARAIAGRDLESALRLANESLRRGLSSELVNVLNELQQKSSTAAQAFYERIVSRVKEEDLSRNNQAASLACNLLNSFSPPKAREDTYRELLEMVVKAALLTSFADSQTAAQAETFYNSLSSIMSETKRYAPGRAQTVTAWAQDIKRSLDPEDQMQTELEEALQNGTVDDLLALIPKHPAESGQIYQQAAWKAANSGDLARARLIAMELISDPMQRRQILEQLGTQAVWKAVNEDKIAEARALVNDSIRVEQRVQILLRLAEIYSGKRSEGEATICLDEARILLDSMPRTSSRMNLEIQLANSYYLLDPKRGFSLLETITKQLNELIAAAVVMDGFDNHYLKNGEWIAEGPSNLGNTVSTLRHSLGHLARIDFERAKLLSEQFERPEIRLLAQLDIARISLAARTNSRVGLGKGRNRIWIR